MKQAKKQAKKIGRPSKFDSIDLAKVEQVAALGATDDGIAAALGIAHSTLENYKKKPAFLDALKNGKEKADRQIVAALYKKAVGYETVDKNGERVRVPGDTGAMIFWLINRKPEEWRQRSSMEHSGKVEGGGVIQVVSSVPRPGGKGNGGGNGKTKNGE